MDDAGSSDAPDAGVPPVQQVALEAIHTLRAFLDLAEVAVTDPELRGQLMTLGRDAWEALMPPEQRANVLATIAMVVRSLGDRDGDGAVKGLTVGVDVGGTKCLGVVLDGEDNIVAEIRVATPAGGEDLISTLAAVIGELVDLAGEVDGVGIGLAGQLDLDGVMRYAPNLVGADEFPFRAKLQAELDLPLRVENDANCSIVAEFDRGAIVGVRHAVMVNLGTGIGSAMILDGRLYRGHNGMAGEWGHTTVVPDGAPCACGRRGCWEAYASGAGLVYLTREITRTGDGRAIVALAGDDPEHIRGEHVTRAARQDDHEALAILDHFARWLALGIANIAAVVDPEAVVLGGGVIQEADLFIEPVRHHFSRQVLGGDHRPDLQIVPAKLGERAGALGAAIIARDATR